MEKSKTHKFIATILLLLFFVIGLIYLYFDLDDAIFASLEAKNFEPLKEKFDSYGLWAFLLLAAIQAVLVMFTVIPSSPIQIVSGFSLGSFMGFLASIGGIVLGNMILYVIVKKFGSKLGNLLSKKEMDQMSGLSNPEERILSKRVFLLYLLPFIPYGIISITVARSKIRFPRYLLLTTIASIPSVLLCIMSGSLIISTNYIASAILIGILILSTVFYSIYHRQIMQIFSKPKMDMEYFQKNVCKPKKLLYFFAYLIVRLLIVSKVRLKSNAKTIIKKKGPYLLLYNHPSRLDWAYSYIPIFPNRPNSIIAYYYFCNFKIGKLLHNIGGFPKFLFQPDVSSVKNIKRVINWKNILAFAPEGRLCAYGQIETITPATDKLIKHLEVPVVICKMEGSYLTCPKWAKTLRRGRIDVTYEEILTAEEIKAMSHEKIGQVLAEKLYYDDFAWQEKHHVYFKGKRFAEGLEHILYICPVCHEEYSYESHEDHIHCTNCGTDVVLNHYYQFETKEKAIPKTIRDWYLYQKDVERKRIEDPNYRLESKVTLKLPDPEGHGFVFAGTGTCVLTKEGIRYQGSVNGEEKDLFFKIQNLPAVPFGVNEDFEVYHHNTLYYFIPENIRSCVKWSVVGELLYQNYIKENE